MCIWCLCDMHKISKWYLYGIYMIFLWYLHDVYMMCTWCLYEFMMFIWCVYDIYKIFKWYLYDVYMILYDIYLISIWWYMIFIWYQFKWTQTFGGRAIPKVWPRSRGSESVAIWPRWCLRRTRAPQAPGVLLQGLWSAADMTSTWSTSERIGTS